MKNHLLALLLLAACPLVAAPPPDIRERLDRWLTGQPGGVVLAWVDADGTAFFPVGKLGAGDSRMVTPDTPFEIGSVSKVFTALLLAESEQRGRVSRRDPAAKYLVPQGDPAQAALAKISLLSLTTHTSGLPRLPANIGPDPGANPNPYAAWDSAALVEALRLHGPVATPGRRVAYSNFGVAVLGEALGSAWRTSYAEALHEHVLLPLGMKATSVGLTGAPSPADLAPGHAGGKPVPGWTWQAAAPAGGLRSSARDMARFLAACLGQGTRPLAAAIAATVQPQHQAVDIGGQVGLGWFITDEGVVWHNGATAGSHAFVAFNPKTGAAVAILANVQLPLEPLGFGLLGARPPQPKVETVQGAADYAGRYPLSPAFVIDVTERNGVLSIQATGQPALPLRTVAADRFAVAGVPAEISFERDAGGKVVALVLHQNGLAQRAPRGELPPPPKEVALAVETLREYVGEYPLTPQFVITITEADGTLYAQATGQGRAPVFASAKDEFFYKVVNAQISFRRDASDHVTGLVLHQNGRDMPAQKTK